SNGALGGYSGAFLKVIFRAQRQKNEVLRLRIENWPKDRNHKVCKIFRSFVQLKPANHAVFCQIFADTRFGNFEMLSEQWLDIHTGSAVRAATRKISNRDAQRVARFRIVVSAHFLVGENKNARSRGSTVGLVEFCGRTSQQAPELHLQKRKSRRKPRISKAAFYSGNAP